MRKILLPVLLLHLTGIGCTPRSVGGLFEPCLPDASCDEELTCVSGVCVNLCTPNPCAEGLLCAAGSCYRAGDAGSGDVVVDTGVEDVYVFDCNRDGCGLGTYCATATGQCVDGCLTGTQCGPGGSCDLGARRCQCPPDSHWCPAGCLANNDPGHCGLRCEPCPGDPHGAVTCDGLECGLSCVPGYHLCPGEGCLGVGTACSPICLPGYHTCPDTSICFSGDSVHSCGTRCETCPDSGNGQPFCAARTCGEVCYLGYHFCPGQGCLPDARSCG